MRTTVRNDHVPVFGLAKSGQTSGVSSFEMDGPEVVDFAGALRAAEDERERAAAMMSLIT